MQEFQLTELTIAKSNFDHIGRLLVAED
jgi:CheY-like chemotaxis protein